MRKRYPIEILGYICSLVFILVGLIRYVRLIPDPDRALVFFAIGFIGLFISWQYNCHRYESKKSEDKIEHLENKLDAVEVYLADQREDDKNN